MLTREDLAFIQTWVEGERKALEWAVGERTFQICGVRGAEGCWERFFHAEGHPTRRKVSESEIVDALEQATSPFEFYRGQKGSGEFFESAEDAVVAAKTWCGQS